METQGAVAGDRAESGPVPATTRRGFLGAVLATVIAALIVGLLWLAARDAPSAGRDPQLTPPLYLPTRPAPTTTPAPPA
jgi:hypothetical protein